MISRRRSRRTRTFFWRILALTGFAAAVWLVFFSPVLLLRTIEVSGTETLDPALIRSRAETWLAGTRYGIFPKRSLFFYDPDGLRRALAVEFFRIADVTVTPVPKSRTIRINIAERQPEGIWCGAPETCFLFDLRGTLFEAADPRAGAMLAVRDERPDVFGVGDRAFDAEWASFFRSFFLALQPEVSIRSYTIEPESVAGSYVRARTTEGWDILVGVEPGHEFEQAEILKALLSREIGKNASRLEYVDLRVVPGKAYYKLR